MRATSILPGQRAIIAAERVTLATIRHRQARLQCRKSRSIIGPAAAKGTNTELEGLKLGPCAAGEQLQISFAFLCELCNQEYTLTVASHDPDGVWHDWLEDAIAFAVADSRYTAGVANLRAAVRIDRLDPPARISLS